MPSTQIRALLCNIAERLCTTANMIFLKNIKRNAKRITKRITKRVTPHNTTKL